MYYINNMTPSVAVKTAMIEEGYSVHQLAKDSRLTPSTIYGLLQEKHKPQIGTLKIIADTFNRTLKVNSEDLSDIEFLKKPELVAESETDFATIPPGLKELLKDKRTIELMQITDEEIKFLKGLELGSRAALSTADNYLDFLLCYRKMIHQSNAD